MTKRSVYRTQRVESFVEVRVVYPDGYERSEITLIAEGDFPEWNEIL